MAKGYTATGAGDDMGWQIFIHSIKQVLNNLSAALRISGALFLVQVVVGYALGVNLSGASEAELQQRMMSGDLPWFGLILVFVITVITGIWIAVAWHRYVLKLEMPTTFIPPFHTDRMLGYFGNSLLLMVIAIPIALVMSLIVGFVAAAFYGGTAVPSIGVGILIGVVTFLPVIVVIYRLSVILPGSALGEKVRLGEAWSKTVGSSGAIILLAVLSILAAVAIDLPLMVLASVPVLGIVWSVITAWLKMMVGISILTTLYGHFVEKRPLL